MLQQILNGIRRKLFELGAMRVYENNPFWNFQNSKSTIGLQFSKNSKILNYRLCLAFFWPFFRPLRPRRGHQHSKFCKDVEQKLFLSVQIFENYSSSQFFAFEIFPFKSAPGAFQVKPPWGGTMGPRISTKFFPRILLLN
jgi:hypothetical protein